MRRRIVALSFRCFFSSAFRFLFSRLAATRYSRLRSFRSMSLAMCYHQRPCRLSEQSKTIPFTCWLISNAGAETSSWSMVGGSSEVIRILGKQRKKKKRHSIARD